MNDLQFHPLANVFPLLDGEDFEALQADIAEHGVREAAVLYEGQILDGRNRYRAAMAAGVDCPLTEYHGSDPVGYVVSLNLRRRHLTESQRAMVAAKLATLKHGGDRKSEGFDQGANLPVDRASDLLNVSERSVKSARSVRERGDDSLVSAVEHGDVSVSAAADVATLPKEKQAEIVAKGEREILEAARSIRAEKAAAQRERRVQRIAEISKGNSELGTEQRYPVIYADPPWRYENPPMGSTSRSIENHYPTMSLDEICALPVGNLAADDAILYLWATAPKLAECMKVIEAWGFEYRTNMVWDKMKIGMGYYARNQHELLLICRRGEIPPPKTGEQPPSVIQEPRGEHSAKPARFYEIIESAYPDFAKIELFCRSPREGWAAWGNQAGSAA